MFSGFVEYCSKVEVRELCYSQLSCKETFQCGQLVSPYRIAKHPACLDEEMFRRLHPSYFDGGRA